MKYEDILKGQKFVHDFVARLLWLREERAGRSQSSQLWPRPHLRMYLHGRWHEVASCPVRCPVCCSLRVEAPTSQLAGGSVETIWQSGQSPSSACCSLLLSLHLTTSQHQSTPPTLPVNNTTSQHQSQSTTLPVNTSHSQQHLAVEISGGQRWALIQYTTYNNLFCYQLLESYYSQIVLQDIKEGFSVCVSSNPINIQPIFAYDWRVWCRVMSRGWRRWPAQTATSQWRRWSVWRKPSRSLTGTGTVRSALRSLAR